MIELEPPVKCPRRVNRCEGPSSANKSYDMCHMCLSQVREKAEAERDRLTEALDGITTVAETLIQEGAINGSLAIRGWCNRARKVLEGKP